MLKVNKKLFGINKNLDKKLFSKFILPYILILIVPMLLSIGVYRIAANIVKEDIKQSNISMLNQAKNIVDEQLRQIDNLALQIATNNKLATLLDLKEPSTADDFIDINNAIEELNNYTGNMSYLDSYYIYMKNSNYILTQGTLYNAQLYYSSVLKYDPSKYKEWLAILLSENYNSRYVSFNSFSPQGLEATRTSFVQSIPFGYNQAPKGSMILAFKNNKINELISNIDITKGGYVYVANSDGQIITSLPKNMSSNKLINSKELSEDKGFITKKIDGDEMIITYVTSHERGWKYVIVLPSKVVLANLNKFTLTTIILFVFTILGGFLIAFILAYINSKPVFDIVSQLKQFVGDDSNVNRDAFSLINGSVSNLISANNELQKDINENKTLIHSAFLDKLIRGQVYNEAEFLATSKYLQIDISKGKSSVILVKIFNNESTAINLNNQMLEELNISKTIIRGVLAKYFTGNVFFHDTDQQTIAIILNYDVEDTDVFYKEIENIMADVKKELVDIINLKVDIGGGEPYSNPLDLWHSFEGAEYALENLQSEDSIVWAHDVKIESENYYYPIELEQRLFNFTKQGDKGQVENLLDFIYNENFNNRSLSGCKNHDVIKELKSTIRKVMPNFKEIDGIKEINDSLRQVSSNISYDTNFKLVSDAYYNLCDLILEQKGNSNANLINKIMRYIESNYNDQSLGLYKVASEFNLSEGYVSQFFKEQANINFTDYLEKIRMDNAYMLLENNDLSINEIAEKVGYNSAQSFRRAFKRVFGMNPTNVRKN
jgi:AraC-like DNA-binding protein